MTTASSRKRARVSLLVWQVRDTCAPLSPIHGTGEYQPRGEYDCWGGALLGDNASFIIISSASNGLQGTQTTKLLFLNLLFFF